MLLVMNKLEVCFRTPYGLCRTITPPLTLADVLFSGAMQTRLNLTLYASVYLWKISIETLQRTLGVAL